MSKLRVGFAVTGSFCTFSAMIAAMEGLVEDGKEIQPIFSEMAYKTDTRFGEAADWISKIETITSKKVIHTITEAEPIGPKALLDILVVAPCTGNTLAKLANGITDSSVTMACKAHLRNNRPLLLAVSTNDGLSGAAQNIGRLQARKNIYFVPYKQDDAQGKPCSLVADLEKLPQSIDMAMQGEQLQPLLI